MGNDVTVGIKFIVSDAAGNQVATIDKNVKAVAADFQKAGVAAKSMGTSIEQSGNKAVAKLTNVDSYVSKIAGKWSKFIVGSLLAGGGVKVLMELARYTEEYAKSLEELAKGHDAAALAAQNELAVEQQNAATIKEVESAIGGLIYNFKVGLTDALLSSTDAFSSASDAMQRNKEGAFSLGEGLGMVARTVYDIGTVFNKVGSFIGETIGGWTVKIHDFIASLTGLPKWVTGGTTPKLGGPQRTGLPKFNPNEGVMGPQYTPAQWALDKARTEETRKFGVEAKKAHEMAEAAALKHTKALEDNDTALAKLVAEYGGLNASWSGETRNNLQMVSDLQTQLGLKTEEATDAFYTLGKGAEENSTIITDGQWQQIQMQQQVTDATTTSMDEIGQIVDETSAGMQSSWSKALQFMSGGMSGIAGPIGQAMGNLGKEMADKLSQSLNTYLTKDMGETGKNIYNTINDTLGSVADAILPGSGAVVKAVNNAIGSMMKWIFGGKPAWEKLGEMIGRDLGYSITEELAKTIQEQSKEIGKDKAVARNLSEIIGDITNQADMAKAFKAVIDQLGRFRAGLVGVEDLAKSTGEVFTKMLEVAGEGIDKTIVGMIRETQGAGLAVKEIADYVKNALGQTASGIMGWSDALKQAYEQGSISAEEYKKQLQEINDMSQITFDAMIAGGQTLMEAWTQLGEGAPFKKLIEANKLLLTMIDAQQVAYEGMAKAGLLSQQQYADYQTSIMSNYDQLIAKGFSQKLALQEMAPSLQTLVEMSKAYGFEIDANTLALIKQAQEQGLMTGTVLETNDIMMQGFASIIKALGGDIPAAWQKYIDAANEAADATGNVADNVANISKHIPGYKYETEIPAQHGFHGYVTQPTRILVGEGGRRERVDISPSTDNRRYDNRNVSIIIQGANKSPKEIAREVAAVFKDSRAGAKDFNNALNKGR